VLEFLLNVEHHGHHYLERVRHIFHAVGRCVFIFIGSEQKTFFAGASGLLTPPQLPCKGSTTDNYKTEHEILDTNINNNDPYASLYKHKVHGHIPYPLPTHHQH
jgi:hypothetical protein